LLRTKLSGISIIDIDYTVRLLTPLALKCTASYFIRNDLAAYKGPFTEKDEYFLGGEAFGQLVWSPVSDIQVNLGGGVFLPGIGNTSPDSKPLWRVSLNCIIALF
jgi:hypothetical protein